METQQQELLPNWPNYTKRVFLDGIKYLFKFDNGLGASVVRTSFSYGGKEGLWELAVLDSDGKVIYNTPITSDVEGFLTEQDVENLLNRIKNLIPT